MHKMVFPTNKNHVIVYISPTSPAQPALPGFPGRAGWAELVGEIELAVTLDFDSVWYRDI